MLILFHKNQRVFLSVLEVFQARSLKNSSLFLLVFILEIQLQERSFSCLTSSEVCSDLVGRLA